MGSPYARLPFRILGSGSDIYAISFGIGDTQVLCYYYNMRQTTFERSEIGKGFRDELFLKYGVLCGDG